MRIPDSCQLPSGTNRESLIAIHVERLNAIPYNRYSAGTVEGNFSQSHIAALH